MLGDLSGVLKKKGIDVTFTDSCVEHIAVSSYSEKYGARNMRRFIQNEVEDKIAGKIVETRGNLSSLTVDFDGNNIVLK